MPTSTDRSSRAFFLVRRPASVFDTDCFELRENTLPPLAPGEVLVDNLVMSVDPYMYVRAAGDGDIALGGYEIGDIPDAHSVGRVRETRSELFQVGDLVTSFSGWRDSFNAPSASIEPLPSGFDFPPEEYLAAVGNASFTAWTGLNAFVSPLPGQTMLITGAAGGVGMIACQMALRAGLRVVASAGSDAKCAWLASLGDVRTINYRKEPSFDAALAYAAPEGLDLCFDNVGGRQLEAAIRQAKSFAHIIACGAISTIVNDDDPTTVMTDLRMLPVKCITMHGYTVSRFFDRFPAFLDYMRDWVRDGGPSIPVTVFDGLASAPAALKSLFGGNNLGKTVVRLG